VLGNIMWSSCEVLELDKKLEFVEEKPETPNSRQYKFIDNNHLQ
jgi:hypothetical protein